MMMLKRGEETINAALMGRWLEKERKNLMKFGHSFYSSFLKGELFCLGDR